MPEASPRARNCPIFRHSDARYALVAEAISDDWQSANDIGAKIGEIPNDVAYQLRRLVADGKAERREEKNAWNRKRVVYRAVR